MRKIDADRLKKYYPDYSAKEGVYQYYSDIRRTIDSQPTVEEVTGEWIEVPYGGEILIACSKCRANKEGEPYFVDEKYNYCPHCGSKNREVE